MPKDTSRFTSHVSRFTSHASRLLPKSEFTRNVLTLMTGTTIAQAIPIAISPILTRLYTPEDFGVFALFMAIVSIFGSIANGSYEYAIMLPKKDKDAINIFALGFIINVVISLTLLIIILIFHDYIIKLLNNKEISPWLYFVPLVVFFLGFFNILTLFNIRLKKYKDISESNVVKSLTNSIIQLSLGLFKIGAFGLITGQIVSSLISNLKLFHNISKLKIFKSLKKIKIIAMLRKYKNFLLYSTPHNLLNILSNNIVIVLFSYYFSINQIGFYYLVDRIFNIPLNLISSSVGQVFFRELSFYRIKKQNRLLDLYKKVLFKSIFYLFPLFAILLFIVHNFTEYIFGEKWLNIIVYVDILFPMFFIRSIGSILSHTLNVFNKQKEGLYIEIINFLLRLVAIIIGGESQSVLIALILYSSGSVFITLYRLYFYYHILKQEQKNAIL